MGSNYDITYPVDLVLCIDCTGSMGPTLDRVKQNALRMHGDLKYAMEKKGKKIGQLRIRVIAYRDYLAYMKDKIPPMLATDFFALPQQTEAFAASVNGLQPLGGGDDPEDGLEALAYAMRSDWSTGGPKHRHIIVVWTDAAAHPLGFGRECDIYPPDMAKDMAELTTWWGDGSQDPGYMPDRNARRLVLYAPDEGGWKFISDNWKQVIHCPVKLDNGIAEADYAEIIDTLANSI